jgi:hypothetical protein
MSKDNINEGLFGAAKEFSDAFFDGLKTNTTNKIIEKAKQRGLPKEIVDNMLRIQKEKEELLQNFSPTMEYSKEDILDICEELYQHELLSVFKVDNIDDPKISENILKIWLLLKENKEFTEIMEQVLFLKMHCFLSHDIVFTSLFNYDYFFIMHQCICEVLENGKIEKNTMEQLKNIIQK